MQARIGPEADGDPDGRGRPLVVTSDGELLDELVGLATAGGVEVSVAIDAVAAEDRWASAPLVVVGADQVAALARRNVPRRLGVILVGHSAPGGGAPGGGASGGGASVGGPAGGGWPDATADGAGGPAAWLGSGAALHPEHVVVLPEARSWLVTRFAECRPAMRRHVAPVLAFVAGHPGAGASLLATGVALAARRRGLATLLVAADRRGVVAAPPDGSPESIRAGRLGGAAASSVTGEPAASGEPGATLAVLSFDRADAVAPDAVAAALRAARHGRDLVVVDLPHAGDDAARLALSGADRGYLVVVAGIRECAAATRVAAAVRRHCPRLGLVVRVAARGGLRPDEVAEALDLPLVGVLPARAAGADVAPGAGVASRAGAAPGDPGLVVAALCRRLLAQSGAVRRFGPERLRAVADVSEVRDS
jgi:secretion/DNA translocation related CpaE-like protein